MKNIIVFFILFTITTYAIAATPRLDAVEAKNVKLSAELLEAQKSLMQQELNNKNLERKINELQDKLNKLKDSQDNYHIEKITYDSKMQANTNLVTAQDKRISDLASSQDKFMFILTFIFGLFGYFTYTKSKQDAKEIIEQWINNEATPRLDEKITKVLKTKDDEINYLIDKQIKNRIDPEFSRVIALVKDIEQHGNRAEKEYEKISTYSQKIIGIYSDQEVTKEDVEKIEAKSIDTLTAEEHYTLGVNAIKKSQYNTALNEFNRSIELSKNSSSELEKFYLAKGFALIHLAKYDEAISTYRKAIEINSSNDKAFYNMAIAYDAKKEYDNAINAYKKAIKLNPSNYEVYNNMGYTYDNNKQYDEAIKAYDEAIKLNPNDDNIYNNKGITYDNMGWYKEAIEAYNQAISIDSKNDITYYNLGNTYDNNEQYEKAIKAYEEAIKLNPNNYEVYNNMGYTYDNNKQYDEAIKAYKKAINIKPSSPSFTNLFELQLTQNQSFDQELEKKYIELFQNEKESYIQYEMLKIFQDITHKKEVNLEQWKQKYEGVSIGNWSFDELEAWINGVEDSDVKAKLQDTLAVFKEHE